MTQKSNRREFLKGKSAANAARDLVDGALPDIPEESVSPQEKSYLVQISHDAMACEFEISLNAGQYDAGTEAALDAMDRVDALEEQLSVFRDTSEVCRVNRLAAERPVEVEPSLFGLLQTGVRLHAETDGALDLTSSPLSQAWGFSRRQGRLPSDEEISKAMRTVGTPHVHLNPESHTVRFDLPGVELNLGSIGKGHAIDVAAEVLRSAGVEDFLFHGGQSSVLAVGSCLDGVGSADEDGCRGWTVGIAHPMRPGRRLATIRLRNRALATSGSAAQFFRHEGKRYGHILDPRTGRPAEGVLSATVLAPNATLADGLSTAFYVLGPDRAMEYCDAHPNLAAVLVCPTRKAPGFEVLTMGLPDNALTPVSEW